MKPKVVSFRASASSAPEPIDTVYDVVAPENVSFQFRLAGPFVRAKAFCLDVAIVLFWFIVSTLCLAYVFLSFFSGNFSESVLNFLIIFNAAYCFWFWLAVFEAFCGGRTPGKLIFGLRVISSSGHAISIGQAFLRNVLRLADATLGPFVVPIMGASGRQARLGDLAAGTLVVNERLQKKAVPAIIFRESNIVTVEAAIPDDFIVSEPLHKALSLYVARRLEISPPRRYEIASSLAAALARRARISFQVDPDAFLCALWQRATGGAGSERVV